MKREAIFKRLVSGLRVRLGKEEFDARYQRLLSRGITPAQLLVLGKMQVRMDGTKNHKRPHLHCSIGRAKHAATIAIDDGSVLAGRLTKRQERVIESWVKNNKIALNNLWKAMQGAKPVDGLIQEFREQKF